MKRLSLYICCSFVFFWGSVSFATATPIHDNKGGGVTPDDAGFVDDNGQLPGGPAEEFLNRFPGQSGFAKYNVESIVPSFKDEEKTQETKNQNRYNYKEEGREVSNPAPATLFLLGTGLIGLAAFRRKRPVRT